MKLLMPIFFLLATSAVHAQNSWQPSPSHTQIPIWPGAIPDARPTNGPENVRTSEPNEQVAGRPWLYIVRVAQPTMTVYSPQGNNSGAAVIVFPGGGYEILAI